MYYLGQPTRELPILMYLPIQMRVISSILSFQAQQTFTKGLFAMAAYNYNVAKDASSISAEISSDAFDRNPILNNANKAINSNSLYGNKHRFIAGSIKKI